MPGFLKLAGPTQGSAHPAQKARKAVEEVVLTALGGKAGKRSYLGYFCQRKNEDFNVEIAPSKKPRGIPGAVSINGISMDLMTPALLPCLPAAKRAEGGCQPVLGNHHDSTCHGA